MDIEAVLRRRMRLPEPKEKVPVTPLVMSGLALPFVWAAVYPVDRLVLLWQAGAPLLYELLVLLTAAACALALLFSPRDDVVPWETVPEPRQRLLFFVSCGIALAGVVMMRQSGAGFQAYFDLALAVLTCLWLVLPYMALSGNFGATRLLLLSMRMGMVWWTSMFFLLLIKDGMKTMMASTLPADALGFLGLTYWWFLMSANRMLSEEAGERPALLKGWQVRYWLSLAVGALLVLLWVLTGFTNNGIGVYGGVEQVRDFPFYDAAAMLSPEGFSNGPRLLLHSIPWRALLLKAAGGLSSPYVAGLLCLGVAAFAGFGAVYAAMQPVVLFVFAVLALGVSIAAGSLVAVPSVLVQVCAVLAVILSIWLILMAVRAKRRADEGRGQNDAGEGRSGLA